MKKTQITYLFPTYLRCFSPDPNNGHRKCQNIPLFLCPLFNSCLEEQDRFTTCFNNLWNRFIILEGGYRVQRIPWVPRLCRTGDARCIKLAKPDRQTDRQAWWKTSKWFLGGGDPNPVTSPAFPQVQTSIKGPKDLLDIAHHIAHGV